MKGDSTLQRAIYGAVRAKILDGTFGASRLPSERELAAEFGVARSTLTRVLTELEHDGLVVRRQGLGTFVTRKGLSRKIGLLVPETATSEFFTRIVHEISRLCQQEGYTLLFAEIATHDIVRRALQAERVAKDLVAQGVSGVIFSPVEHIAESEAVNRRILSTFDRAKVPVVLCDYDFAPYPARSTYDVVSVDNFEAGARLCEYLYAHGARNIHFHTLPHTARSHQNRLRGVIAACVQRRGKWTARNELIVDPYDMAAVRRHLRRSRPDAIICGNDNLAVMLDQTLAKLGYRVPQDILVTGFNDVSIARLSTPTVTTMHQPCADIGAVAFRRLISRMADPALPTTTLLLSATLVERESTSRS